MPTPNWNLRSIKDTRENVVEAVQSAQNVPPSAKAFLVELLNSRDDRLVCLDVHYQADTHGGRYKQILTLDITGL